MPEAVTPAAVRAAIGAGEYAAAARAATELLRAAPDSATAALAHYLRGLALTNLHDESEAVAALRAAVRLDDGDGLAHFLLAGALGRLGRRPEAARSYARAAAALLARPPHPGSSELDGRDPADLVALCNVLSSPTGAGR
jgi:Flp pilus assembly protein TadD